ncbi:hypothetical protein HAQ00_02350 [Acidithiobacillus caldus ATCC 51756]|jgi:hypothetical protein|uniref:hypothetical protein n=1 Tax=Acidithiobacillus caldus TaxID=33059 RepID=UPI001C06B12D|nr:hypothetical protein [Acidithiobacillus caldus]MBU2734586.1 hypothetical protein [Acidithiobacillus caldus ATCC 51756]MBU2801331.1 hypothetical protein [Acidithiobacillus caldus]
MEEKANGTEQAGKGAQRRKRPARAPIPGMTYAEVDGQKRAVVDDYDARMLANRKLNLTIISPQVKTVGEMLRFADVALQRIQGNLSLATDRNARKRYRDAMAEFDDAQAEFTAAIMQLLEVSGVSMSNYMERRFKAANGEGSVAEAEPAQG